MLLNLPNTKKKGNIVRIEVIRDGIKTKFSSKKLLPGLPRKDQLIIGVNTELLKLPRRLTRAQVTQNGVTFNLGLPSWWQTLESHESRSTSNAKYLAKGNFKLRGKNVGALLQLLPAGRETSCHWHRKARERFLPLSDPTPILYTGYDECQPISPNGHVVETTTWHQLLAPREADTLTLILMFPIKEATCMDDHVYHPGDPFVPYTSGLFDGDVLPIHGGTDSKGRSIAGKDRNRGLPKEQRTAIQVKEPTEFLTGGHLWE